MNWVRDKCPRLHALFQFNSFLIYAIPTSDPELKNPILFPSPCLKIGSPVYAKKKKNAGAYAHHAKNASPPLLPFARGLSSG